MATPTPGLNRSNLTATPIQTPTRTPDFYVGGANGANASAQPVWVERGPPWLAELLVAPPDWLSGVVVGLLAVLAGWTALGYYRHGIDEDVIRESAETVLTVLAIMGAAYAVQTALSAGYAVGVLLAVAVGYVGSQAGLWAVKRSVGG